MARDAASPLNPTITVQGAPLDRSLLDNMIDLRVDRRLGLPATFTMRFRDRDFSLIDADKVGLGDAVEISIPDLNGTDVSIISGEVTAIGVDPGAGETHEFVVSGLDLAHRLTHSKVHRTYLNVSPVAIVQQIASRVGLTAQASGPTDPFEYLLQIDSDHRFLDQLARRCGCDWWVEQRELHFAPPADASPVTLTWGDDLRRFKLRVSTADQTGKITVTGWDDGGQQVVLGTDGGGATDPTPLLVGAKSPVADQLTAGRKTLQGFSDGVRSTHTAAQTAAEATTVAKALAADLVAGSVQGRGETVGRPELRPGGWITVDNMGRSMSGTYALTDVEHVWGAGLGLVTRFSIGRRRPDDLVDLLGGAGQDSGPLGDVSGSFTQAVTGVVTNIDDPDKVGRVKVKLGVLGDQAESTWCRVVAPGAGAAAGLALQPAVGDEVLVVFERGDLRRPLVLGGLWSKGKAQPGPLVDGGKATKGIAKSRKGHQIEFGDGDGDADSHVLIKLANGTVLRLGSDKVTLEVAKGPFSLVAGKGSLAISETGDVTIQGENVTIKATQALSVQGGSGAELKSSATLKLEGATTGVKGSTSLKLESGGIAEVTGAMVKLG